MAVTTFPDSRDSYRGFANFVAPHLDTSTWLFKRFSKLNTINLLYMQAELLNLEQELHAIAYLDEHCGDAARIQLGRSVAEMKKQPYNVQWSKILEVRTMLEAYSKRNSFPLIRQRTAYADSKQTKLSGNKPS